MVNTKTPIGGPYSVQAPLLGDNANIIRAIELYHLGETGSNATPSADSISGHLNTKANISGQVFTGDITAANVTATANLSVGNNLVVTSTFTAANISVANITSSGNVTASGNLTVGGNEYLDKTFAQKVIDVGSTYNSAINTYTVDFAQGSYFSNIALQKQTGTWTLVSSANTTIANLATGSLSFTAPQLGDLMFITLGTDAASIPTVTSAGWTQARVANTTVGASIYYKLVANVAEVGTTVNISTGSASGTTASTAVILGIFRNSKINAAATAGYLKNITVEGTAGLIDVTETNIVGASMTTKGAGNVVILSYYAEGDVGYTIGTPTGYSTTLRTISNAPSVGMSYKLSSTANTAVPTNWNAGLSDFSGNFATFAAEFSAVLNPTIIVSNATVLNSTNYKASAYVVDLSNDITGNAATDLDWSGITINWAYGSKVKPGTSTTYNNTIYMFQTKSGGTSYRGAGLLGYA